jgi:hypothetical protein
LAHRQQAIAGSIDKTKALLNLGAREVKQQCNKTYSSSFKTHNARLTAQMFDGGFFAFLCKKGDSEYLSV